ncbi:dethiobiotin synthase [Aneurinibacillus terranovensis]|uniref:dethiobiotin synthase n=1 Tax=Aneurinibacillus terranovensis TaxID=278991 RepID=UPI0003FAB529|nr:dethiobiotin synthase [Aneurinibacillus terranovensis]
MNAALFITGTGTGVGKTSVTAYLNALLQSQGIKSVPYKPVQSGCIRQQGKLIAEDVEFYRSVSLLQHTDEDMCSYRFEPAVSPHLAARSANSKIDPCVIKQQLEHLQKNNDFVIVEGAGGIAVPLADGDKKYMIADLIKELELPLVLVTHPGLGTINHTLLSVAYAKQLGIPLLGLVVNSMPDVPNAMEEDNVHMITHLTGLPLLGTLPIFREPISDSMKLSLASGKSRIDLDLLLQRLADTTKVKERF